MGTVPFLVIVAGLVLSEPVLDKLSTGSGGWSYAFVLTGMALYTWLPAVPFAIASIVSAFRRISKIRRYNRENGTAEPGIASAALCASLSAMEVIAPLSALGLSWIAA